MFHLEGLIPKLCQLAEEDGDDDRALRLRSAGLKVLASMVLFSLILNLFWIKKLFFPEKVLWYISSN